MKIKKLALILLALFLLSCQKESGDNGERPTPVYQKKSSKRGVAFAFQLEDDIRLLSPGISWSYNWSPSQPIAYGKLMIENDIDFYPMAWNSINEEELREYILRYPDCEYLLAFNEPNLTSQANMTPQEAAARWPEVKAIADELGLKVISPAMNYGTLEGYHDPIVWLDEFFELVPLSHFDGIAIHCYMSKGYLLKRYVQRFKKYNKALWLTEFCAWDDNLTQEKQREYMSDAINYLEGDPWVFRYAWFKPRYSTGSDAFPYMALLHKSYPVELTELGQVYTQMSSQDKTCYYVEEQTIEAEHYSAICISESTEDTTWTPGPQLRLSSDAPNESLELYNFVSGQWVEYQIAPEKEQGYTLELRYACIGDTEIEISQNGTTLVKYILDKTGYDYVWNTASIPLTLLQGRQCIRLSVSTGKCTINWLRYV